MFSIYAIILAVRIKEKPRKLTIISNILGVLGGVALCFGILFKIMHWPFANILMNLGGFFLILIFLPIYLYTGYKTKQLKTKTIAPVIIAIAGFSLMFSLIKLRNSNDVLAAQHNIQYNIDNKNLALNTYNQNLLGSIKIEQLNDIQQKSLQDALEKTKDLTTYIDNLIITSFWSINQEGMTRDYAIATLDRNYAGLGDVVMDLNVVRGKTANNESLESLLLKVAEFENQMTIVLGSSSNFVFNEKNFEEYVTRENSRFPVGIVLQDLTTLKLQVQNSQSILLAYYKGKVS